MKLLLYSDVHISRTSSILPLVDSKNKDLTCRQQMLLDTSKWICELAQEHQVDAIINLGDTLDQHTITSYDIKILNEFFKNIQNVVVPHYVLLGNHEKLNNTYNAIELLQNINGVTIITEPTTLYDGLLAFLPYYDKVETLPKGEFLFSHNDIQGSVLRGNILLEKGIEVDSLKDYKVVFNGHIHKSSRMNNIINVGSTTTHSFSDDNEQVPKCYIFDTDTLELTPYENICCPLFRSIEIETIDELKTVIENLDNRFKYVLKVTLPYDISEESKMILLKSDKLTTFKLVTKMVSKPEQVSLLENKSTLNDSNSTTLNITDKFNQFINTIETQYPKELYFNITKVL